MHLDLQNTSRGALCNGIDTSLTAVNAYFNCIVLVPISLLQSVYVTIAILRFNCSDLAS